MDRTNEFKIIVSLNKKKVITSPPLPRSDIMIRALNIRNAEQKISDNLEHLYHIVKSKSLFLDQSSEIEQLSSIINTDINRLNRELAHIPNLIDSNRSKHEILHLNLVIENLNNILKEITSKFAEALQSRTRIIKEQETTRIELYDSPIFSLTTTVNTDKSRLIHNIEQSLKDLQHVFSQLTHLIQEQNETIEDIENNTDMAFRNVEYGQSQLLRYFNSVSSNRNIILKVVLASTITIIMMFAFL